MGGSASVRIKEIDLSTRVASFEGVFGALVIPAKKGPSSPFLNTSDTQFLNTFTPDGRVEVGYDLSYFSALSFLERANKLWVKRVHNGATFSGLLIKDGTVTGSPGTKAFVTLNLTAVFSGPSGTVTIESANPTDSTYADQNAINLFNGNDSDDIDTLVATYNGGASVADQVVVIAGGTLIPDSTNGSSFILGGGVNAVAGTNNALAPATNLLDPTAYVFAGDEALLIHGANAGDWANDIGIKLTTVADDPDLLEPNSFLIEVFKTANQVVPVESFLVSRVLGQKDGRGLNMYVEDVLEGSEYIRAIDNGAIDELIAPLSQVAFLAMGDGDDGLAVTDSNMVNALSDFDNTNDLNVTLIMDGGYSVPAYQLAIDVICQSRQDCVGIFSTPFADEASATYLTDLVDYRKTDLNANTSYSALYTPHLQIQDRFNDRTIWIAPDGHVGGSISFSANSFEIWFPPAGFTRGALSVLDTRRRFSEGEMDVLYDNGINPIRFYPGKGIIVWGQKTLLARASALDRLNVRLLLIVIEPAIKEFLENYLFELNDVGTRSIVETKLEAYFEGIKARRGITDYDVVVDASNNTADDIDNNRMNVDIFIKPTRSIEEIPVRVVITPNNISFGQAQGSI